MCKNQSNIYFYVQRYRNVLCMYIYTFIAIFNRINKVIVNKLFPIVNYVNWTDMV